MVNNTNAAIALAGAVRSTLGPRGSDKMLVDENGEIVVTNDGVTVLETARLSTPLLIFSSLLVLLKIELLEMGLQLPSS